jgi:transposase-like protein
MGGKATRIGLWKCYQCRKQFTVKVGTIFEDSHVPMNLWLQAMYLLCSSKKGISSNQLSRTLGVTLKTAWFMSHRIREAMRLTGAGPMGGEGETVEIDETYIGRIKGQPVRVGGATHKHTVLTLVERGGSARSFHIDGATVAQLAPNIRENVRRESRLMTDEMTAYRSIGKDFASHDAINHGKKEYVRREYPITGEPEKVISTNTVEGYYSIFKRGMKGVYQHCQEKHLHRYLCEFDFRYSNRVKQGVDDVERTARAVQGAVGKRLTYR